MRTRTHAATLAAFFALAISAAGCGKGAEGRDGRDAGDTDAASDAVPGDFSELQGTWHYTGSRPDFAQELILDGGEMTSITQAGTDDPMTIISEVIEFDNDANTIASEVTEQTGIAFYEIGDILRAAYRESESSIDLYGAEPNAEEYPVAEGGVEGTDYYTYTRQ